MTQITAGRPNDAVARVADETSAPALLVSNPYFFGWPGQSPVSPKKNEAVLGDWITECAESSKYVSVSFAPALRGDAPSGLRIVTTVHTRWIRLLQPISLAQDNLQGCQVRLTVGDICRDVAEPGLALEWVALLTEDPQRRRSFAQRLVVRPSLSTTPWTIESEHEISRYDIKRPLLLALQFTGGPGAVQLSQISLETVTRSKMIAMPMLATATATAIVPVAQPALKPAVPPPAGEPLSDRATAASPSIIGALDEVTDRLVTGWAFDLARPSVPVTVDLFVDEKLVSRILCNRPRPNMRIAVSGGGDCAFSLPTPPELCDGKPHLVRLSPTNLTIVLQNSPREVVLAPPRALPVRSAAGLASEEAMLRAQPLSVFAALLHIEAEKVSAIVLDGLDASSLPVPAALDPLAYRTLHEAFSGCGLAIDDVWFGDDAMLMVRLTASTKDTEAEPALVLRAFQGEPLTGEILALSRHRVAHAGMTLLEVPLANAYAPVLVVAHATDGRLLGTTLLPFPSLCRGGRHSGELSLLATGPARHGDLRAVSDALVRETIGVAQLQPPFAIAAVQIDLTGATGAEPVFAEGFLAWLAGIAGLGVIGTVDPDAHPPEATAYLQSALRLSTLPAEVERRVAARRAAGSILLRLPADAMPTLSAILSRRLRPPQQGNFGSGAMVVANATDRRPAWSVSFPAFDETLLGLQPAGIALGLPLLLAVDDAPAPPASRAMRDGTAEIPLAVRFVATPPNNVAAVLRPTASDSPASLLRTCLAETERTRTSVTLLLPMTLAPEASIAVLDGLALQTLAANCDVVALSRPGDAHGAQALREALQRRFPGRFELLDPGIVTPSAALNLAATRARGRYLLVADEPVLMHDSRTLEVLVTMLGDRRAATAGCVAMTEIPARRGPSLALYSGGFFPAQIALTVQPSLVFDEPASPLALPAATYPVVGNAFRLALVRSAAWLELGGLDAERFPAHQADLDFALRALRAGWRHLCTSAVSMSALAPRGGRLHADPVGAAFLPPARWQEIAGSVTLLRAIG